MASVRPSACVAAHGRKKNRLQTTPAPGAPTTTPALTTMKSLLADAQRAQFCKKAMASTCDVDSDEFNSADEDTPVTLAEKRRMRETRQSAKKPRVTTRMKFATMMHSDTVAVAMNRLNEKLLSREMSMMHDTEKRFGGQLTRDMTKMVDACSASNMAEMLRLLPIAAWFGGSFILFSFLCKVVFGPPDRAVVPDTWSATALSQVLCSGLYIPCMLMVHNNDWRWCIQQMCSVKYLTVCFPYSIAYAVMYFLWCEGFKYIATASGVAVFQSRMFLDMFFAYLVFAVRIPLPKILMVTAVFVIIVTHTMTISAGAMSKDPELGRIYFMLYALTTAMMNSWFPFWVPKLDLSPVLLSFVSSLMTACICIGIFCVGPTGPFSNIVNGYITSDVWVFVAWVSIDAAAFFCPIWVSPLFMTLCQAMTMPILYLVEIMWFQIDFVAPQFMSVFCVALAVTCVALYQGEVSGRVEEEDEEESAAKKSAAIREESFGGCSWSIPTMDHEPAMIVGCVPKAAWAEEEKPAIIHVQRSRVSGLKPSASAGLKPQKSSNVNKKLGTAGLGGFSGMASVIY